MRKKVEEGQKAAWKSKKRNSTAMCLIASFHYSIIIERLLDSGLMLTQGMKRQAITEPCLCGNYILAIDILNLQAMEWSSGRRWYQIKCLESLEIQYRSSYWPFVSLFTTILSFRFLCRCLDPDLGSVCVMGKSLINTFAPRRWNCKLKMSESYNVGI